MNNIQKNFQTKNKLRQPTGSMAVDFAMDSPTSDARVIPAPPPPMPNAPLPETQSGLRRIAFGFADGGRITPAALGGSLGQVANMIGGRQRQLDEQERIAMGGEPAPVPAPAQAAPVPAPKPQEKGALRKFFGFADGGAIQKNTIGGVNTYTDAAGASAGAKTFAPTPGQNGQGGSFSVLGVDPGTQAANDAAQARMDARNLANAPKPVVSPLQQTIADAVSAAAKPSTPAVSQPPGVTGTVTPAVPSYMQQRGPAAVSAMPGDDGSSALRSISQPPELPQAGALPNFFDDEPVGLANGGKVRGKGGPTEDKVGPVMLSPGEYVLPADTAAAVGHENLERLRAHTHDFTDADQDDKKMGAVSGLRKMASGGTVVDPFLQPRPSPYSVPGGQTLYGQANGPALRVSAPTGQFPVAQGPVVQSATPGMSERLDDTIGARARAAKAARMGAAAGPAPAAAAVAPEVAAAEGAAQTAAKQGLLRRAGGTLLRSAAAPGALAIGAMAGAKDSFNDLGNGRRDQSQQDLGVETPLGSVAADSARTLSNVGNAMTFGLAGRLGQGLSSAASGGSFAEGFSPTAPNAQSQNPTNGVVFDPKMSDLDKAGVLRNASTDSVMGNLRRGQAPGSGFAQTNIPDIYKRGSEYVGVGKGGAGQAEDPIMSELRSALRGMGNSSSSRVGGRDSSNDRAINKRYDDMLRDGSGRSIKQGLDWSQRHGLSVEKERADALGEDARNQTYQRGQDVQAGISADNNRQQERTSALQSLTSLANTRMGEDAKASATRMKALADQLGAGSAAEKEGLGDLVNFSTRMFPDTPEGKQQASEMQRYVLATNAGFLKASPLERNRILTDVFAQSAGEGNIRKRAASLGAPISQGRNAVDPEVVDITAGDVWNDRAKLRDWRPWRTDSYQVKGADGNPVLKIPTNEYLTRPDGSLDADLMNDLQRRANEKKGK